MSNVKKGTKIEAAEAKTLDPARRGLAAARTSEVEGQELDQGNWTECPWCGQINVVRATDLNAYNWYECRNCGRPFRT